MIKLYKNYLIAKRNHEYKIKNEKFNEEKKKIIIKRKSLDFEDQNKRPSIVTQLNQIKNITNALNNKRKTSNNILMLNSNSNVSPSIQIKSPQHRRDLPSSDYINSEQGESATHGLLLITNNNLVRFENLAPRGSIANILHNENNLKRVEFEKKMDKVENISTPVTPKLTLSENEEEIDYKFLHNELKISKLLSYAFTKKVMIILITMMIIVPMFDEEFWENQSYYNYFGLVKYLERFLTADSLNKDMSGKIIHLIEKYSDPDFPIINVTINNTLFWSNSSFAVNTIRSYDLGIFSSEDSNIFVFYSKKKISFLTGIIGIVSTFVLAIILSIIILVLEYDSKKLILDPLEVMIEIVENLAKNPMTAKDQNNLRRGLKASFYENLTNDNETKKGKYEIKVIEDAIVRISALLAIGFGDAGKQIIKENLNKNNELHPMIKGRKKKAIFGFCDVRDFAKINMALEQDIMLFINEIAEIVHSSVDKFQGSTNKNIGECFLSVWKLSIKKSDPHRRKSSVFRGKNLPFSNYLDELTMLADNSLFAFIEIIKKINTYSYILEYSKNPKIVQKLGKYKVDMGFGLHFGWAIEGSIGSLHKIDASYLSPNVNIASRLQSATKYYGVNLLISGELYDLFSEPVKSICRLIDKVTVKGSENPLRLFTVDINPKLRPKRKEYNKLSVREKKQIFHLKKEKLKMNSHQGVTNYVLNKFSFLEILKSNRMMNEEFLSIFQDGVQFYFDGVWAMAAKRFEKCLEIDKNDGPTKCLYEYIKKHNNVAPDNWAGYRQFTSK